MNTSRRKILQGLDCALAVGLVLAGILHLGIAYFEYTKVDVPLFLPAIYSVTGWLAAGVLRIWTTKFSESRAAAVGLKLLLTAAAGLLLYGYVRLMLLWFFWVIEI